MLIILLLDILLAFAAFIILLRQKGTPNLLSFDLDVTKQTKGLMAILIVLCHLGVFSNDKMPMGGRFVALGLPVVTIFFFISGYGLMFSFAKKGKQYLDSFFSRRLPRLLVPLVLVTVIGLLIGLLIGKPLPTLEETWDEFIHGSPLLLFSWFVYALLASYIAFYFAFRFCPNKVVAVSVVALLAIALIVFSTSTDIFPFTRATIFGFPLGAIYYNVESRVKEFLSRSKSKATLVYALTLFVPIALLVFMKATQAEEDPETLVGRLVVYISPIIFVLSIYLVRLPKLFAIIASSLGAISYEIYLVHGVVFEHYIGASWGIAYQFAYVFASVFIGAVIVNQLVSRLIK